MATMLALRRARLEAGDSPLGWKVGFGTEAALRTLGTERPLVGFLLQSGALEPGSQCSIEGWGNPVLEPEVGIHIGRDVGAEVTDVEVMEAIDGLGPAIEMIDIEPDESDPEAILAANVFQQRVMIGKCQAGRKGTAGVTASILRNGEVAASTDDVSGLTGTPVELVRLVADSLAGAGEVLRAGEVVIGGSIVPGVSVEPGDEVTFQLPPLGVLEVRF